MAALFTDQEIDDMLAEAKPLPSGWRGGLVLKDRRGHKVGELPVQGANGKEYRLILRQNRHNPLDFSVILGVMPANSNQLFRLRRNNGKSHEHKNRLEGDRFYDFHIHAATQRYQENGQREDAYAFPTAEYQDFHGAKRSLLSACGFVKPDDDQASLLGEDWT